MNKNIRIRIADPCHEDWNQMQPEERGRFCAACSKVVVDFSMMTDTEVIQHLARAGSSICGRMAPAQLERNMALPGGEERRRRNWWHWLVAGLLVTSEARAQAPVKAKVEQVGPGHVKVEPVSPGQARIGPVTPGQARIEPVSPGQVGKEPMSPGLARMDVVSTIKADSARWKELPTVTVCAYATVGRVDVTGAMSTVRAQDIWQKVDTLVTDTLAAVGLAPKPGLRVYPNPARRGTVVTLDWRQTELGLYEVGLFNTAGALVERQEMEVGGKGQVNLFALPPALPAGMYLLRASLPGGATKVITLKIMVL